MGRPGPGDQPRRVSAAGVELVVVRLPLVAPWRTALGSFAERDVLLVRVDLGDVEGWGECVAQGEPTYTAEYVEGALDVTARHLLPRLLDRPALFAPVLRAGPASPTAGALAAVRGHPMAKAALEAAWMDALLRREGRALADHLNALADPVRPGPVPTRVPGGVALGVTGDVAALVDEVARRVDEGYRRVKLKVHPGWDLEPVAAVRARWPDLLLQVDANGSYAEVDDPAAALAPLDDLGLLLVEQPLGDDDLLGHARLAAALATPICLDESVTSAVVAATALALGAAGAVNVKAGRVGGLHEAVAVTNRCRAAGVPVWCGGMLETGIGRAANLALATVPGFDLPGDLSASARFWAEDVVTVPAVLEPDGTVAVPSGPGTGVEVRADLDRLAVSRRWFPAGG